MAFDRNLYQLVVIDFQVKLAAAMPEASLSRGLRATENLVFAARELGIPILFTEQYPQGLGPTVPSLAATYAFEKTAFSAMDEPGFEQRLLDGRVPVLAGMEAHVCVAHTACDLIRAGRGVIVVTDACVSRREEDRTDGLQWIRSAGVNLLPSETLIFGWLGRSDGPLFREISRRIR
ncbi:MAG: isochorismatase family protein [Myxococcales bacterium]|nr:isochorismatase family protein [Myxococcales bacterium]